MYMEHQYEMAQENTRGCSFPTCFRTTTDAENQFCAIHEAEWQEEQAKWEENKGDNPGYLPRDSYEEGWIK